MCKSSLFFTSSPTFVTCGCSDDNHSDRCQMKSHCDFDLRFSCCYRCWASFHAPVGSLFAFFEKVPIQTFFHFLIGLFFSFLGFFFLATPGSRPGFKPVLQLQPVPWLQQCQILNPLCHRELQRLFVFCYQVVWAVYMFWILTPDQSHHFQIFSSVK